MPGVAPGGRVIELESPGRFKLVHRPLPVPGRGEVVVHMTALGICGTDVHMYTGRGGVFPHVVGHDGVGVVSAIGDGVPDVLFNRRVAIDPIVRCGSCAACRLGKVQLCSTGGYLGMLGPGLAAEYVRLPFEQVVVLPDAVSDLAATVLEPIAVALHTLSRVGAMFDQAGVAAIVGAGPLGVLMAQVLEHAGWVCHLFEPQRTRRDLAKSLGLSVFEPHALDLGEEPRLVVETSAAAAGVDLADDLCTPGSIVAVVGRAPASIAPASVLLKELTLVGVKGGASAYPAALQLVADGVIDPKVVVTHQFGWLQADEAFSLNVSSPDVVVRAALTGGW